MIYYISGNATKVNLKTLETEQVNVDMVVCRKEGKTAESFHYHSRKIEYDTIYLHRDASHKLIELLPYLLEQDKEDFGGQGLCFQRGFSLVDLLRLSDWYEHIDTSIHGIHTYGNKTWGSTHLIGLDLKGDLVIKIVGEKEKETVVPYNFASTNIKELEIDRHLYGRSAHTLAKIQNALPGGWDHY